MVQYRRNRVAGGSYFFTVTLRDRRSAILVDHIDRLREAFRETLRQRPFTLDAIVVLPDHLHAIWTLPPDDADYAGRWRAIKSRFTRSLVKTGAPFRRNRRGEYGLWQPRYWEHTLRDSGDWQRHMDYLHYNPVKHGHVTSAGDWPYSSLRRYQARGLYPPGWGEGVMEFDGAGHE